MQSSASLLSSLPCSFFTLFSKHFLFCRVWWAATNSHGDGTWGATSCTTTAKTVPAVWPTRRCSSLMRLSSCPTSCLSSLTWTRARCPSSLTASTWESPSAGSRAENCTQLWAPCGATVKSPSSTLAALIVSSPLDFYFHSDQIKTFFKA